MVEREEIDKAIADNNEFLIADLDIRKNIRKRWQVNELIEKAHLP